MLDSLVRVSRRVDENHFISDHEHENTLTRSSVALLSAQNFVLYANQTTGFGEPVSLDLNPARGIAQ